MKSRCTSCLGQKKVMKLGMIMGACPLCNGTGSIETHKPKEEPTQVKEETITKAEPTKEEVVHDDKMDKRKKKA